MKILYGSEIAIPKIPSDEIFCHLCDAKRLEYEKKFILDCLAYTQIRSQFQKICHNTNLPNLLTHQNYGFLGIHEIASHPMNTSHRVGFQLLHYTIEVIIY